MDKKIIITGVSDKDITELAKKIIKCNDNLSITPHFTTDDESENASSDKYIYFMSSNTVNLSYKNNALLTVNTENYITTGVTIDDFYNNDILCVTLSEFNSIIESCFKNYEIVVVWLDSKNKEIRSKNDILEAKYLNEKISKGLKYMYFLDCDDDTICSAVVDYCECDDEDKANKILEKYS